MKFIHAFGYYFMFMWSYVPKFIDYNFFFFLFLGAAQCLGELYRYFGRKITSGLFETTVIVTKLVKFNEVLWFNFTIL